MLARKIVSIHPAVILAVMLLCAAGPTVWSWIVRPSVDDLLIVYRVATAPIVVLWSAWLWAINTAALEAMQEWSEPRQRRWFVVSPCLAVLPFLVLPNRAQDMGGVLALLANVFGPAFLVCCGFCLWKTAEALERMVAPEGKPSRLKIFSSTVLLGMFYIAPFVVARRFAAYDKAVEVPA